MCTAIEAPPIVRLDVVGAATESEAEVPDCNIEGDREGSDVGRGGERVCVVVEATFVTFRRRKIEGEARVGAREAAVHIAMGKGSLAMRVYKDIGLLKERVDGVRGNPHATSRYATFGSSRRPFSYMMASTSAAATPFRASVVNSRGVGTPSACG